MPIPIDTSPKTVSTRGCGDSRVADRNTISKSLNDLKKCYSMPSIHHDHSKQKKGKGSRGSISIDINAAATTTTTDTDDAADQPSPTSIHGYDSPILTINMLDSITMNTILETSSVDSHDQRNESHHRSDRNDSPHMNMVNVHHDDDESMRPISSQVNSKQRTLYVGSGLGIKHNEVLNSQLDCLNVGSAQYKLKKILGDQFD